MFEKLKIKILGWIWDHSKVLKEIAEEDENLIEKVEDDLMNDPERLRELAYVGR